MKQTLPLLLMFAATTAFADDTRQLDAHEHGVGELNIAFLGKTVAMEFHAPGADIVGFEYEAKSSEDRAAIDDAVAMLARPLNLFMLPAAAECSVTQASAELEGDDAHHEHHEHGHDDEKHEHEEHAEGEHAHDEHEEHAENHDAHEDEAGHTEFHAEYMLTCANPDAITEIKFAYFDTFENAREVEVKTIIGSQAQAFEVTRDAPLLDLRGVF